MDRMLGSRDGLPRDRRRPNRLDGITANCKIPLLERLADTHKATVRTDKIDEPVDTAIGRLPDFRPDHPVLHESVAVATKLIGAKRTALGFDTLSFAVDEFEIALRHLCGNRVRQLIDPHDFRAQRAHHPGALLGVDLRHHRDERYALVMEIYRADRAMPKRLAGLTVAAQNKRQPMGKESERRNDEGPGGKPPGPSFNLVPAAGLEPAT
ncbi:hypothetical protein [Burkholderia cepacia]|uniref:hypothetical protein n=1 Tax=Burkholderia cepacia TaxID=292 RepID=UPI0012D8B3BC|nr:hypothetical protein [Burkholderia cepacia]